MVYDLSAAYQDPMNLGFHHSTRRAACPNSDYPTQAAASFFRSSGVR
jgi:hypothetical protein